MGCIPGEERTDQFLLLTLFAAAHTLRALILIRGKKNRLFSWRSVINYCLVFVGAGLLLPDDLLPDEEPPYFFCKEELPNDKMSP
jgi:hypothetical protein